MIDKELFRNLPEVFKQNSYFPSRRDYDATEGWFGCTDEKPTVMFRQGDGKKTVILSISQEYRGRMHPDLAEVDRKKVGLNNIKIGFRYICFINQGKVQFESYDGTLPTSKITKNFLNSI